jgi:hypothetical protein
LVLGLEKRRVEGVVLGVDYVCIYMVVVVRRIWVRGRVVWRYIDEMKILM